MSEDLQNEITNDYNIKVYLGSLDGSRGEWVTLPLPEDELDKVYERCESIGGEAFILDSYQTPLTEAANYKIDQYDNIYDLNILAHIASCTDYDPDAIEALASYNSFKNPIEIANAVYQCDEIPFKHFTEYDPALSPEENFANQYLAEVGTSIPEEIEGYIDLQSYGKDLGNDYVLTSSGALDLSAPSPDLKHFSKEELKEEVSQFLFPEKEQTETQSVKRGR